MSQATCQSCVFFRASGGGFNDCCTRFTGWKPIGNPRFHYCGEHRSNAVEVTLDDMFPGWSVTLQEVIKLRELRDAAKAYRRERSQGLKAVHEAFRMYEILDELAELS